jgi:hypothetical protein
VAPGVATEDRHLSHGWRIKQYSDFKEPQARAPGRDSLRQNYVGAAGGRIVIPPYPAANELSGIYETEFARGVDTREVKSRFDNSRPLVPHSTSCA